MSEKFLNVTRIFMILDFSTEKILNGKSVAGGILDQYPVYWNNIQISVQN